MNKSPFHKIAILFLLFGCAILFSCQENAVKGESRPTGEYTGIKRVFERGPVTVMVEVDQKEISIAERLNLVINVTADEDYEVELPGFGENLEQFGIGRAVPFVVSPGNEQAGNQTLPQHVFVLAR